VSAAKRVDAERIAVVTGGAGAIGGAIVAALRADGHRVVVIDRDAEISADLGSEASTRRAAAEVLEPVRSRSATARSAPGGTIST
jgi:nucleoside-diphosphate-sugar epimerase